MTYVLLHAAGFAPLFPERPLDDPALRIARHAVDQVLAGHEPFPALAIDRHWTLIAANRAAQRLMSGVSAVLAQPPINVLRLALHPDGLALHELRDYPAPNATNTNPDPCALAVPFRLLTEAGEFAFFSTITVFGTPVDITLSELALEAFYPADAAKAEGLRRLAE